MKYLLITIDGVLHREDGDPLDYDSPVLGIHGADRVSLDPRWAASGWVSGSGLLFPETYPRNPMGAVVLCSLGAAPHPVAGPVVITGFTRWPEPDPCDIDPAFAAYVTQLHDDARIALDDGPLPEAQAEWAEAAREVAVMCREAGVPPIRILNARGDELSKVPAGDADAVWSEVDRLRSATTREDTTP